MDQGVQGSVQVSRAAGGTVARGVFSQRQYTQPKAVTFHPLQVNPPVSLDSRLVPTHASSLCVPALASKAVGSRTELVWD